MAQSTAPLRTADAADPYVAIDEQPWLFTTNTAAGNVPVVTGGLGGNGVVVADALPRLPDWAEPGFTWAPAVTHSDAGWVLAFTALHAASGRQCIGVATSSVVGGPYDPAAEPLVCDIDRGGSIDPSFVTDDAGAQWLLYKDDGNCCGQVEQTPPRTVFGLAGVLRVTALLVAPLHLSPVPVDSERAADAQEDDGRARPVPSIGQWNHRFSVRLPCRWRAT